MVVGKGGELTRISPTIPTFGFLTPVLGRLSKSRMIPLMLRPNSIMRRCVWTGRQCSGPSIHVKGIGTAWFCLIGPGGIEHPHEDIAVYNRLHGLCEQRQGDGKPGLVSMPLALAEIDGDLGHIGLFQRPADKADIVGGTAAAGRSGS